MFGFLKSLFGAPKPTGPAQRIATIDSSAKLVCQAKKGTRLQSSFSINVHNTVALHETRGYQKATVQPC